MDDFKRRELISNQRINGLLTRARKKIKKKTRKKQKGKENFKKLIGSSLNSDIIKPGEENNLEKSCAKTSEARQEMEGMFFMGLRSNYISRKTLNEATEDIKVLLQRGGHLGRTLKSFLDNETNQQEHEESKEISSESFKNLEHCPLSPIRVRSEMIDVSLFQVLTGLLLKFDIHGGMQQNIQQHQHVKVAQRVKNLKTRKPVRRRSPSSVTLSLVQDEISSTFRKNKRNKLDLEKEFEIFWQKYDETVGNEVLLQLPKNGVLEDALNAVRKIQKIRQTYPKNVSKESQRDEVQLPKELKFSPKYFESEKPATENLVKNFIWCDNLSALKNDYCKRSVAEKHLRNGVLMFDELKNNHPSFQPIFSNDDEDNLNFFALSGKNLESSAKDLRITTPPIQFYRRNMF